MNDAAFPPSQLARCRAHDPMAFRAFVVRHERMVFALLSRMLGHGPEVEDELAQSFGPEEAHRLAYADAMCAGTHHYGGDNSKK
jgi:hypothetical protein